MPKIQNVAAFGFDHGESEFGRGPVAGIQVGGIHAYAVISILAKFAADTALVKFVLQIACVNYEESTVLVSGMVGFRAVRARPCARPGFCLVQVRDYAIMVVPYLACRGVCVITYGIDLLVIRPHGGRPEIFMENHFLHIVLRTTNRTHDFDFGHHVAAYHFEIIAAHDHFRHNDIIVKRQCFPRTSRCGRVLPDKVSFKAVETFCHKIHETALTGDIAVVVRPYSGTHAPVYVDIRERHRVARAEIAGNETDVQSGRQQILEHELV